MAKLDHMLKYNGEFYQAGEDDPRVEEIPTEGILTEEIPTEESPEEVPKEKKSKKQVGDKGE